MNKKEIALFDTISGSVEKMEHFLGGIQYIFKFDNGYGASVIKFPGSYGYHNDLWELAVTKYDESGEWNLCYDTPITDDVIGHLTEEEVRDLLKKISELVNEKRKENGRS